MLRLYIGYPHHLSPDEIINSPREYVKSKLRYNEILNTDFGIRILKECSAINEVYNGHSFRTDDGYNIGIRGISSGVCALLIMLTSNYLVNMSRCGDNCNKFVAEIARMKDLSIFTTRFYNPFERADLDKFVLLNNDKVYYSSKEYMTDKQIFDYYEMIGE